MLKVVCVYGCVNCAAYYCVKHGLFACVYTGRRVVYDVIRLCWFVVYFVRMFIVLFCDSVVKETMSDQDGFFIAEGCS